MIVSVCGPSGSGKSTLAKAIVEMLGSGVAARVPGDYYLVPRTPDESRATYLARPMEYDWALIAELVELPDGTVVTSPAFDFEEFRRSEAAARRTFTVRRVLIVDALLPYPDADLRVLLRTDEAVRRARIVERDRAWGTRVADRWENLERTAGEASAPDRGWDVVLDGADEATVNAARVAALLRARDG